MTLSTLPSRRHAVMVHRPSRGRARFRFDIARHDIRSTLPAVLQPAVQNGLLVRGFQQALAPMFMFPALADNEPWSAGLGDTATFTRAGLLLPVPVPITGADPAPSSYGVEQWSMTMDQYGNSLDTNLMQSAVAIASKFKQDTLNLGENAGESMNIVCRNRLYTAYRGGNTYNTVASNASTSLVVADPAGFGSVLVNGSPTPVSGAFPKAISIPGVGPNTVIGVNVATSTLTLGTAATVPVNTPVIASDASSIFRPNAKASAAAITAADTATFATFRSVVARLRQMHVKAPYTAHIDATTEAELFSDPDFKQLYQGRADLPQWQDQAIGRFGGIDWVRNTETETVTNPAGIVVHRPIVIGQGAVVAGPLDGFGEFAKATAASTGYSEMIEVAPGLSVAWIIRPPQDRLQQVVSQSWTWVGDWAIPSDITERTPDAARYKRAVIVEHA